MQSSAERNLNRKRRFFTNPVEEATESQSAAVPAPKGGKNHSKSQGYIRQEASIYVAKPRLSMAVDEK